MYQQLVLRFHRIFVLDYEHIEVQVVSMKSNVVFQHQSNIQIMLVHVLVIHL